MSKDPEQYFDQHVFFCTNQRAEGHPRGCCANHKAENLRAWFKLKVKEAGIDSSRVNSAGCLDRCELGPVMVIYPEGIWYSYQNQEDLQEILDIHLQRGERVDRLMLKPEDGPN